MKNNKFNQTVSEKQPEPKVEVSKEVELEIHEKEDNAIIVNIDGWRMRVYFDESLKQEQKENLSRGKVLVRYFGDIEDVHSLRLLPLK